MPLLHVELYNCLITHHEAVFFKEQCIHRSKRECINLLMTNSVVNFRENIYDRPFVRRRLLCMLCFGHALIGRVLE